MKSESTLAPRARRAAGHALGWLCECTGPLFLLVAALAVAALYWQADPRRGGASARSEAIVDAARRGDVGGIERAVADGASVNAVENGSGMTPLMWATRRGHRAAVEWLLAHGADQNATAEGYGTPLAVAAAKIDGGGADMVRLLLRAGADPNRRAADGHTPLMYSAARGDAASVELLLRAGADVNARDHWGNTPLTVAAEQGHPAVARRLIDAGALIPAPTK